VTNPTSPYPSLPRLMAPAIMCLKLGQVTTIIISSADTAKQVFQTHDQLLCNRTIPDALRAHKQDVFGLPWIPVSTEWRNLRKISNGQLFASKTLDANQGIRRKKVQELLAETHQSSVTGEIVDIGRAAFKTALNLLSNTIFSVDLADPNSNTAREFKEIVWNVMEEAGKPNLADYFPVLKKIDPQGVRRRMTVHFGKLIDLFDRMISQRLKQRRVLSGSMTSNSDMLDTLLNITEENNKEMDKSKIEHLFVVVIITALLFFDLFHNQEFFILTSSCYIRTYLLRGLIQPQPHWNGLWQSYSTTQRHCQKQKQSWSK
jgi:cytochrome P450